MLKYFFIVELSILSGGPTITPGAEVPKAPGEGAENAAGLNHSPTVGLERLGFDRMFGRRVTVGGVLLVVYRVLVGSGPVHCGVRKNPPSRTKMLASCQPPKIAFSQRPASGRKCLPLPTGRS